MVSATKLITYVKYEQSFINDNVVDRMLYTDEIFMKEFMKRKQRLHENKWEGVKQVCNGWIRSRVRVRVYKVGNDEESAEVDKWIERRNVYICCRLYV